MEPLNAYQTVVPVALTTPVERLAFLRKVYGLLALSTFMAAGAAWVTSSNEAFLMTVAQNQFLFFIAELAAIFFTFWARKQENLGLIALFTFTSLTGVTTAPVLLMYTGGSIVNAALLTGIVFVGLSGYTVTSKKDFSFMGGMLTTGLIVLIVGGLLNALVFHSSAGSFMFSSAAVFLFSGFIIYDTFNIMHRYPADETIAATLSLYLDILNLFMALLSILGVRRD
ncbi:MAG: hypothetical protein A2527_02775 [Candidatus Lambdaproteobacteria bacterium RIFOXYD2_FULL_50_16]|uniref:BAX inhibitor protein n=1 Tax=Candidatus Lambdaproteobacteria bacterium RIFOXYD2_FULL_50_16 TaxID=1817772 RepID=A0A1F6GFW9_9PROT|nr:MAG: hypothetical protein A2527_02775 [Candidatus Lambdaproteobacteria bacterium RIFOXYD2_FULL_50_16]